MLKLIPKILAFLALICSGLTLGVVSIEAVLQLGSHMARYNHANRVALDDGRQRQVRILCIGESTTQGQGGVEDSYPYQLESILNQNNWNTKFQVVNLGISGMLSTEIADKLEQWIYDYKPVAVVSMVGINDSRHQFMLRSAWHDEHHSGPSLLNTSRAVKLFRILWNGVKPKLARIIGLEISSQSVSNFSTSNNRNQRQDLLTRIGEEMASSYSSERELERIVTLKKLYARVGNFRDAAEVTVRLQEILCNSNCPKDSLRGRPLLWKTLRQLNIEASHYFAAAGDYVAAENQLRAALARSEGRSSLRDFFEVDAKHIVYATLYSLMKEGKIKIDVIKKAQKDLGINPDKPNPAKS